MKLQEGIDVFTKRVYKKFRDQTLGVVCHQASINSEFIHISHLLLGLQLTIKAFFGPQHGIWGEKQDNMIESPHSRDKEGRPCYSLYSETRQPTQEMLEGIDTLIVDLKDIGTRIYTFAYTLSFIMKAAKKYNKKVVVLDRKNPVGGTAIEGCLLKPNFRSFVGQFEIPVRHGLTLGELALLFNEYFGVGCDLEVIPIEGGYTRDYIELHNTSPWAWVPPSPNIPTLATCFNFIGSVIFEGTNISEGRGTTKPFHWIGAPFIDPEKLAGHVQKKLKKLKIQSVFVRPIYFQPTFHKWAHEVCGGLEIHIVRPGDPTLHLPALEILNCIYQLWEKKCAWKKPPYEYEYKKLPIDLIFGSDVLRKSIGDDKRMKDLYEQGREESKKFMQIRKNFLIY